MITPRHVGSLRHPTEEEPRAASIANSTDSLHWQQDPTRNGMHGSPITHWELSQPVVRDEPSRHLTLPHLGSTQTQDQDQWNAQYGPFLAVKEEEEVDVVGVTPTPDTLHSGDTEDAFHFLTYPTHPWGCQSHTRPRGAIAKRLVTSLLDQAPASPEALDSYTSDSDWSYLSRNKDTSVSVATAFRSPSKRSSSSWESSHSVFEPLQLHPRPARTYSRRHMSRLRTVPPKKSRLEPGHDSTTSTSTQTPSNNLTKKTVERLECVLIPAWDKDRTRPRAIDTAVDKQEVKDGDLTLAATNRSLIPITAATLSELQPPSQSKSAPRVLHGWWIEKKHALGKVPGCESWVVLHGHVLEPRKMIWHSSFVTDATRSRLITTMTGSCYRLEGAIDKDQMKACGFSADIIKTFKNGFPAGWKATLMRLLNETSLPITDTLNNTNITTVRISKPPILAGSEDMQVAAQHTIRWTTPTVKPRWSPTPGHFYLSAVEIPILPKRPRRSKPPIINSADKSDKDHDERAPRRQQRKTFTTTSHSRRSALDTRSRQLKSGQLLETKQEDTATPAMGMSNSLVPRTLRSRRADTSHALLHSRSTGGHPDRERSESNVDPDLRSVHDTYDDDLLYEIKHAEEHVDVARHGYLDLGDVGTTQALTSTSPRQIDLISAKDIASPNAFQVLLLDSDAKEVTGINTLAVDNHFADHRDHADNVTNRDDENDRNDENNRDNDKRILPQLLHSSERPQDRHESEEKGHDACPTLDGSNTPQSFTSQAPILATPTPKPSRTFFRSLSSISASSQSMIMDIGMHADSISNAALQDDVGPSDSLLGAYDFDTTMTVMPDALAMDTLFGGESEQIQPLDMFSTGFDPTSAIDTPSSVHRETPKPLEQQQQQQPLFNDSLYNYSHILHSPAAEDVVASDGYDTFLEEGDGQPSTDVSNSAMDSLDYAPLRASEEQDVDMAVVDQNDKVAAMEPSVAGEARLDTGEVPLLATSDSRDVWARERQATTQSPDPSTHDTVESPGLTMTRVDMVEQDQKRNSDPSDRIIIGDPVDQIQEESSEHTAVEPRDGHSTNARLIPASSITGDHSADEAARRLEKRSRLGPRLVSVRDIQELARRRRQGHGATEELGPVSSYLPPTLTTSLSSLTRAAIATVARTTDQRHESDT